MKLKEIKELGAWTTDTCLFCGEVHRDFKVMVVDNWRSANCNKCGQLVAKKKVTLGCPSGKDV